MIDFIRTCDSLTLACLCCLSDQPRTAWDVWAELDMDGIEAKGPVIDRALGEACDKLPILQRIGRPASYTMRLGPDSGVRHELARRWRERVCTPAN